MIKHSHGAPKKGRGAQHNRSKDHTEFSVLLSENIRGGHGLQDKLSRFDFYARIEKGGARNRCQDSGCIYATERGAVLGVFDGFYERGLEYSRKLARNLLQLAKKRKNSIFEQPDAEALLKDGVGRGLNIGKQSPVGGTTATLAIVRADRDYSICSVGDSAAFIIGKTPRRLLEYEQFLDCRKFSPTVAHLRPTNIRVLKLTEPEFGISRNQLAHFIGREGILPGPGVSKTSKAVFSESGTLPSGSKLLLTSDGITKNLFIKMDNNGFISEVGGCEDISRITNGAEDSETVGRTIIDAIAQRKHSCNIDTKGEMLMLDDDDITLICLSIS